MTTTVAPFNRAPQVELDVPKNVVPINTVKTTLPNPSAFSCVADIRKHLSLMSPQSRWEVATDNQRAVANKRYHLISQILNLVETGEASSESLAIGLFMSACNARNLPRSVLDIASDLSQRGKRCPSRSTFYSWLEGYRMRGLPGLIPEQTGRVRPHKNWHIPALELYHTPRKPGFSTVARELQYQGFEVATHEVNRLIKSMPAQYGPMSPWRLGKKQYSGSVGPYKTMDKSVYQVGQRYEADGHTVDVWLAHPNTGHIWRPELTIWIDVRSNYVVGWHLSKAESTETTLYSLSDALTSNDHIPDQVHVDNGSGFVSKVMLEWYQRYDIKVSRAIPGNSKGKGLVEGWFKKYREGCDKSFMRGAVYCGDDMSPDALFQLQRSLRRGDIQLPSWEEYRDFVAWFIEEDRNRPQKGLGKKSPADLWATLERNPLEIPGAAVARPREPRTVRRCRISFYNREYEHPALIQYHQQEIMVEADNKDDSQIWAFTKQGNLIAIVPLITKAIDVGASVSEDRQKLREKGRLRRLEIKKQLVRAEERDAIDHTHQLEALEGYGIDEYDDNLLPQENPIRLDILDEWED